jgi:hypothetical protein
MKVAFDVMTQECEETGNRKGVVAIAEGLKVYSLAVEEER